MICIKTLSSVLVNRESLVIHQPHLQLLKFNYTSTEFLGVVIKLELPALIPLKEIEYTPTIYTLVVDCLYTDNRLVFL